MVTLWFSPLTHRILHHIRKEERSVKVGAFFLLHRSKQLVEGSNSKVDKSLLGDPS